MAKVQAVPEAYGSVTPYLYIKGAAKAIELYKKVFEAKELFRIDGPGGTLGHAEIKIGDSIIMMADEHPEMGARSPQSVGGTPVCLMVYVEDVDAVGKRAAASGMKVMRPVEDKFYGDRMGEFEDPFGHLWAIATHKEDVSPDEMKKRVATLLKK